MLARLTLSLERCVVLNLIRLFRIRGQSERVARGFAFGLIVNFFPTFGFGVIVSAALARVLGGSVVAGLVGGASLTLLWPLLFYVNLRTGSLLFRPAVAIDHFEDVTPRTMDALLWGQAFTVGAIVNGAVSSLVAYVLLRLGYRQVRPGALAYFRRHARDHQRRFRRPVRPTQPKPVTVGAPRGDRASGDGASAECSSETRADR